MLYNEDALTGISKESYLMKLLGGKSPQHAFWSIHFRFHFQAVVDTHSLVDSEKISP